ncbi:MAG: hypothetical protein QXV22_00045 [Thermoplasmataceae archaeon]
MQLFLALLGVSIVLAALHMLAPDHWVPLFAASKRRNYTTTRTVATAGTIGLLHGGTSTAIGLLAVFIGLYLVQAFALYLKIVSSFLLAAIGIYFIASGYLEGFDSGSPGSASLSSVLAVSIFPDLSFFPILLSAANLPAVSIASIVIAFVVASALSIICVVYLAWKGISGVMAKVNPRTYDYIISAMLFATIPFVIFF